MSSCGRCGSAFSHAGGSVCPVCLLAIGVSSETLLDIDDTFGSYDLNCEIGEGAMGIVYLAEQTHPVRREVALKVLKPGFDTSAILRRFDTERQALALMEHPNIATLLDAGTSGRGRPFFVMEFVEGLPITAACDRCSSSIPERLGLFADVCRAIEHAHRKGVVHRDIKPSNVLVTERDGRLVPKVIDFGIARAMNIHLTGRTLATAYGELLGTPEYMSPEQASFDSGTVGPASDIYSLGVLLYELLAGVLPFDPVQLRDSGIGEASRVIREVAPPGPAARLAETGTTSDVARLRKTNSEGLRRLLLGDLARVITVCLAKDPQFRYPSAEALAADIERYLRGEPVHARGPGIGYRLRKSFGRYRAVLAAAGIAALACAALIWTLVRPSHASLNFAPLTTYQGSESSPSFSPDANEVAFAWNGEREDNWDIYRLRIGDAAPRRLTSDPATEYSPAWSPDGKTIAFLRARGGSEAQLMLIPAAGGEARALANITMNIDPRRRLLAWYPDNHWLLIAHRKRGAQQQRIFAIQVANGEERQLTGLETLTSISDGQPALSQDGLTLFFARDASSTAGQIWLLPLTRDLRVAGIERRIHIPGFDDKECGAPIPISTREMLFTGPTRGSNELLRGYLSGTDPPRNLSELGGNVYTPEVSRDRRRLVFERELYDTNVWRLDLDAPDGREVRRERVVASTLRDQDAVLSPDGAHLAFQSNRSGFYEIWTASADGSNSQQVTSYHSITSAPQWAPDGRRILFSALKDGRAQIFAIPAAGGPLRQMTFEPAECVLPVFSPDGKWIYYCSLRSGERQLWRIPGEGGPAKQITHNGGFDAAFSPDGRWIYYSRLRTASTAIWRMPAGGGEEKMLVDSAIGGHVFASSHRLYYSRSLPGSKNCTIESFDLTTGRTKVLAATDRAIRDRITVSRDERSIYYTQADQDGMDLMLVSDFR